MGSQLANYLPFNSFPANLNSMQMGRTVRIGQCYADHCGKATAGNFFELRLIGWVNAEATKQLSVRICMTLRNR